MAVANNQLYRSWADVAAHVAMAVANNQLYHSWADVAAQA
jgi:hypothetical protein